MKLKRRLKNLFIDRVDLVPVGTNPGAHIMLYKAQKKTEDGKQFPASDYAYVPDPEKPSTWKLRLTSEPGGTPDSRIVGAAIAALGPGFRGQRVTIPSSDLSAVKRKVLSAWLKANPNKKRSDAPEVLKMEKTPEELQAEIEQLRADKAATDKELEDARKKLNDTPAAELAKAQDEVKKLKEKLEATEKADVRKELDEAKEELASLRKAERERKFVEKAKEYEALGAPQQVGRLLEEADEHFSEDAQKLFYKFLGAASKQVEEGALFDRLSKDGEEGAVSWEDKLIQAARDRVAKGDARTLEQAKVEIMHEDAELRKEYESSVR